MARERNVVVKTKLKYEQTRTRNKYYLSDEFFNKLLLARHRTLQRARARRLIVKRWKSINISFVLLNGRLLEVLHNIFYRKGIDS